MDIIRVEQDGAEFCSVVATGDSAISESGIGRLCGVSHKSIESWIEKISVGTSPLPECLEPLRGMVFELELRGEKNSRLFLAPLCAKLIEYYAFESRRKTKEALFAYRKFAQIGIERWIQGITGWVDPNLKPPEPPKLPDINIPRHAIDILKNPNNLSTNGYRLYLQLQDADRQNDRPSIAELCKQLKITRPTYHKALNLLEQLNLLPSWVVTNNRRQPERMVRDWLQSQIGGQVEAPSPDGPIDLLTDEEVVEVKAIQNWKDGIGHVLVKALNYPDHYKCLLLFGAADSNLDHIQKRCDELDIQLGFCPIAFSYDEQAEELLIQLVDPV
jgi:hypothetical protein